MGRRERTLRELLGASGARLPRPRREDIAAAGLSDAVEAVHRRLGGVQQSFPLNLRGRWDIALDGVAVELDEELHFNRCRALTLKAGVYARLPAERLANVLRRP